MSRARVRTRLTSAIESLGKGNDPSPRMHLPSATPVHPPPSKAATDQPHPTCTRPSIVARGDHRRDHSARPADGERNEPPTPTNHRASSAPAARSRPSPLPLKSGPTTAGRPSSRVHAATTAETTSRERETGGRRNRRLRKIARPRAPAPPEAIPIGGNQPTGGVRWV